jgi:hypothetical protein
MFGTSQNSDENAREKAFEANTPVGDVDLNRLPSFDWYEEDAQSVSAKDIDLKNLNIRDSTVDSSTVMAPTPVNQAMARDGCMWCSMCTHTPFPVPHHCHTRDTFLHNETALTDSI